MRYSEKYYKEITDGSLRSAREMIPLLRQYIQPSSVVDVGCGTGAWLSVWKNYGVEDITGFDGDYINPHQLLINKNNFIPTDLEKEFKSPGKFDLAMSLEVAEHIQPAASETFINSLCRLSNVILFSAAIPGQGGLNHVNEQYPAYWSSRFRKNNFYPYDCLREKIWMNNMIEVCYRQNIIFYVREEVKDQYETITKFDKPLLPLVHPDYYEDKKKEIAALKKTLKNPLRITQYYFGAVFRKINPFNH
jgi:SAM-dependent methyltransferase